MKCLHAIATASFVGLATLVPADAYARSYTTPDPAHDVMSQFEGSAGSNAAPTRTNGDVLASGVTHRPRRVIVAMRFAAMTQTTHETVHQFGIRTNEGKTRIVWVWSAPGHWGGKTDMTRPGGGEVNCRMTTALNYAQHRVSVSIPRRCLSSPRWVRVAMKSVTMENGTYFTDDGQTGTPLLLGGQPVFGPRVRRG